MGKLSMDEKLVWLAFRDDYISRQKELVCHYCKAELFSDVPTKPLKKPKERIFRRVKGIPKELIATVDHVVPVSKGGPKFDETNFVVACGPCNTRKAAMSLEEYMKVKDLPAQQAEKKKRKKRRKKAKTAEPVHQPLGDMKTRLFVTNSPKGVVIHIWQIDDAGEKIGTQPIFGCRRQKAEAILRHIDEVEKVFKENPIEPHLQATPEVCGPTEAPNKVD